MNKRILVVLVLGGLIASLLSFSPASSTAGFGDVVDGAFYDEPVQWMVNEEITTGTSANCFSPDLPVTRGQAAAFMWRMEGFPGGSPLHPFDDVVASWQTDPVSWMFAQGITTGTTASTYSPDDILTRGQLAALLWRLAGTPPAPAPDQFPDVVTSWQLTPVGWMVALGITTGTSATTFSPNDIVTRGQLATFFYRYKGSPEVVVDIAHPDDPPCDAQVAGPALPGAGSSVSLTHSVIPGSEFMAEVLRQLLHELGYDVEASSEESDAATGYNDVANGDADVRILNYLPFDIVSFEPAFEEPLGENSLVVVGDPSPLPQGFLITKAVADEHGIVSLDDINDDPFLVDLFDEDGDGEADIMGCPLAWTCSDIIDAMIAESGWTNIEQRSFDNYVGLAAVVASVMAEGTPAIFYTWTPTPFAADIGIGTNAVWAEVESVLSASSSPNFDQRPGIVEGVDHCPGADADGCQLGWDAIYDHPVARADLLQDEPAAAALLEHFSIPHGDVSQSLVDCGETTCMAATAAGWIDDNRPLVAAWLRAASEASTWEWDVPSQVAMCPFDPLIPIRRAEMVDVLWRQAGSPIGFAAHPFTDVPAGYDSAVRWALAAGVTTGTSATTFSPHATMSRAQLISFLYRFAGQPPTSGGHPFSDVPASAFYEPAVEWSSDIGDAFVPFSPTRFGPDESATHLDLARGVAFLNPTFDYWDC